MSNDGFDQNINNMTEDISDSDIERIQEKLSEIVLDETSGSISICDIFPKLEMLTPRETEVINYRFGLEGEQPHTMEETCERFRVTRERIRRIEAKAGGRRRPYISDKMFRAFLEGSPDETEKTDSSVITQNNKAGG